jgi:hypothetical protein
MSHKKIVIDILNQKVKDLIENFSNPQFVETVQDQIYNKIGEELSFDEVKEILGELITPLLMKFGMTMVKNQ